MSDYEVLAAWAMLFAQREVNEIERGHKRSYDSMAASGEGEGEWSHNDENCDDENYDDENYEDELQ